MVHDGAIFSVVLPVLMARVLNSFNYSQENGLFAVVIASNNDKLVFHKGTTTRTTKTLCFPLLSIPLV